MAFTCTQPRRDEPPLSGSPLFVFLAQFSLITSTLPLHFAHHFT
jgi:hypothetical protein